MRKFFKQSGRAKRWVAALTVGLIAYLLTPVLLNRLAASLIREDRLLEADVIVALGGDNRCHREKRAAELYHQGWAKKVVVSGMQLGWGVHTGEAALAYVKSLGVPEADISMIRDTPNTRVEAVALEKLMRSRGWRSAIIVTSAFHSRRALYTIERSASDLTFCSSPVAPAPPEWQPRDWWARRGDAYITAREFASWANTLIAHLE